MANMQTKWARLAGMSWDEIRTRFDQEAKKRWDWARYRAGMGARRDRARTRSVARGRFFFSRDELTSRVVLVKVHLPGQLDRIFEEAEQICAHRFSLLGYEGLDYGREIDWHRDAVHGKRAPLVAWHRIGFLDFEAVGDHKIIWELNRHQHWVTLAKAWRFSNHAGYPRELVEQWHGWQKANPYPLGINWSSTLEVAFRSISWLWMRELLENCSELPTGFDDEILRGLSLNGWYIERYLSTYFSPNTHLLGEALALFLIGTLCPQIPDAARWCRKGWEILVDQSARQVWPDGMYFEQSLYYHVYALDFFLHARTLAAANLRQIPREFDRTIERMLEVVSSLAQLGPPAGFGDDDGGRLFDPRRNRAGHMTDPLALGAVLFERDDFRARAELTEESVWLFGEAAVETLGCGRPGNAGSSPQAREFPAAGISVMGASEPVPQLLTIEAGPQGTGRSGHGHADALSITYSAEGRRWLDDPGTGSYMQKTERSRLRGTGAHNTLRIDGLDQAVEDGPFSWNVTAKARAERSINRDTFALFTGSHDGYQRLPDPVVHRRTVIRVPDCWIVRDRALGSGRHRLEIFWHFALDLRVEPQGSALIAVPGEKSGATKMRLALLPAEDPLWNWEITEGWISPAYGVKDSASVVRSTTDARLPAESAALLVPLRDESVEHGRFRARAASRAPEGVATYRWDQGRSSSWFIFSDLARPWAFGAWQSDAGFLYCRVEGSRIVHLAAVDVSFVKLRQTAVMEDNSRAESWEWSKREGDDKVSSVDRAAVPAADEALLEVDGAVL